MIPRTSALHTILVYPMNKALVTISCIHINCLCRNCLIAASTLIQQQIASQHMKLSDLMHCSLEDISTGSPIISYALALGAQHTDTMPATQEQETKTEKEREGKKEKRDRTDGEIERLTTTQASNRPGSSP